MKVRSPVSHPNTVKALTGLLGFKVVRVDGLQTELRRGRIHVVVRTFHEDRGTEVRFHEDRGRGPKLVVERSGRLLRFKQRLEAALEKQKRVEEAWKRREVRAILESVDPRNCCPFYDVCPLFRESLFVMTYCYSDHHQCDEYRRRSNRSKRPP